MNIIEKKFTAEVYGIARNINENKLFLFLIATMSLTYVVFEYTTLTEITNLTLKSVIIAEMILFYPIRYLIFGKGNLKNAKIKIPEFSSIFWICISIIFAGIILSGTYYFVNKDNGRYQYEHGLVIDKKTGEARRITIK